MALKPHDDALTDWTKADRLATRKGLKRYGLFTAIVAAGIILICKGMPAHFLWRWLGVPFAILFACAFGPLLFFGGRALWDWLDRSTNK